MGFNIPQIIQQILQNKSDFVKFALYPGDYLVLCRQIALHLVIKTTLDSF